jgi:hypothetical protein
MLNAGVSKDGIKSFVSKPCSWWWSGYKSKDKQRENCCFWSEAAYEQRELNLKAKKPTFEGIRYEHIVPIQELSKMTDCLRNSKKTVQANEVSSLFEEFCHACMIVSATEEPLVKPKFAMPNGWDEKDIWARYRNAMKEGKIKIGTFQQDKWQPINL